MAYDQGLAERIREILAEEKGVAEKPMFGGLSFLVQGNFACGLTKENLVIRVGPERHAEVLAQPHTREMDFTGRKMKGWVYVDAVGYEADEDLADWVGQGVRYAKSLPPK